MVGASAHASTYELDFSGVVQSADLWPHSVARPFQVSTTYQDDLPVTVEYKQTVFPTEQFYYAYTYQGLTSTLMIEGRTFYANTRAVVYDWVDSGAYDRVQFISDVYGDASFEGKVIQSFSVDLSFKQEFVDLYQLSLGFSFFNDELGSFSILAPASEQEFGLAYIGQVSSLATSAVPIPAMGFSAFLTIPLLIRRKLRASKV